MNKPQLLSPEQQARRDQQRAMSPRQTLEKSAEPAIVPAIIPGDPDGLLDATQIRESIVVHIPQWGPNPSLDDELLWLRWASADDPDNVYELTGQVVPPGSEFPLTLTIPRRFYQQGHLLLSYEVENWQLNPVFSKPKPITLDTIAPYADVNPDALMLAVDIITDAYLDQNNDQVIATLPDYHDRADGDTAYFFWVKDVPEHPDDVPPALGPIDVNQTREIAITRDVLERIGNGLCYALYALMDKAGNISRLSYYTSARVAVGAVPENLQPPSVPLAEDGLIDRVDAAQGVLVQVLEFDNAQRGDLIQVFWGDTALTPVQVGSTPSFPVSVPVPWAAIKANYDFADSGAASQPLIVGYQVVRSPLTFPEVPLGAEILVNLKVAGPENPDEPDPVNPALPVVLVRGDSGLDNELDLNDHGKPATVFITLYEGVKAGDLIHVYWKGQRSTRPYPVEPGDAPGDEVQVDVPWELIEAAGNDPLLPVHYIVTDADEVNYQQSLPTMVKVNVLEITLEKPEFPHIWISADGTRKRMNCSSIRELDGALGFYVLVRPDGQYLKAGTDVTLHWHVTDPSDGEVLEGSTFSEVITLSLPQEVNGILWFVQPYETYILPAYDDTASRSGNTHVYYSLEAGGTVVCSEPAVELIGLQESGGGSCELRSS